MEAKYFLPKMEIKKNNLIPEIILIDKPKGISSFDVIRRLRKKYGVKKMGHSGTLDPLATGLMIIGINKGTKKLNKLIKLPKIYEATILLGKKTATGDMEGKILEEKKISKIDVTQVKKVLKIMNGKIVLAVPFYSAVKISGKPLYKLARQGKTGIMLPKKQMEIFWLKLKKHFREENYYLLQIELKVASGTYVRSIAEEIGHRLNLPATVKELRRTKIGEFKVENAERLSN